MLIVSVHRDTPPNTCRSIGFAGLTPAAACSIAQDNATEGYGLVILATILLHSGCRRFAPTVGQSNSICRRREHGIVVREEQSRGRPRAPWTTTWAEILAATRGSAEESRPREIDEMATENEYVRSAVAPRPHHSPEAARSLC